jgi:hypothetical protein
MKVHLLTTVLTLCCAPLLAQAPASAPEVQTHSSEIGFSYSLPTDWEIVDAKPMLPVVHQKLDNDAASSDEKKAGDCVQVALLARHGTPFSVVEIVALPFGCWGQQLTNKDLAAFALGVSGGLKKSFDVSEPVYSAYMLGTHRMWIERANGTPIGHPEPNYRVETACSILKKAAVCWMLIGADDAALQIFEHGAVTLDGDAAAALVPATAFEKRPQ